MVHARSVLFLIPFVMACGSKWNFEDGDGDGISAAEGDCWDLAEGPEGSGLSGSDIGPNAEETWYDGIDQNCNGDDDYDQDGDGFVPSEYEGLTTAGVEGSGFLEGGDCWDQVGSPVEGGLVGADIHPDAVDEWYDGIDSDCRGDDDYDQDGDEFVPEKYTGLETFGVEGSGSLPGNDCNDGPVGETGVLKGEDVEIDSVDIHPDAVDRHYDGIDQDCGGDEFEYDQDGDGHDSANYAKLDGSYGDDCHDGDPDDVLNLEGKLLRLRSEFIVNDEQILAYYGLTPADIYQGAPDDFYDGVDADCSDLIWDDCDADGDGYSLVDAQNPRCEDWEERLNADDSDELGVFQSLCDVGNACDESCTEFEEDRGCLLNDCDDGDDARFPDPAIAEVTFNGIDDDCNSLTGDGDRDGDGYWDINYASDMELDGLTPLEVPSGFDGDCNDNNPDQNPDPATEEVWYDGIDQNCDALDDYDQDGDNYIPDEYAGEVTWYVEPVDGEGGVEAPVVEERKGTGDCDDENALVNPDPLTNERCSTAYDDDCDGDTNDEDPDDGIRFFADVDEDGFGDPDDSRWHCEERGIYNELDSDDCDDESSTTHPGAAPLDSAEGCLKDDDGDDRGDVDPDDPAVAEGTDCDDSNSEVTPDAENERCSTDYDDDCDGDTNDRDPDDGIEFFADVDEDGFGDPADSRFYCEERGVYNELDSDDCDDTRSAVNPDMNEVCATAYDDDCDGDTNDRDPDDGIEFFADVDEDGFGDPADSRFYCAERGVYNELLGDDCDDTRSGVNPDMNEVCATAYDDDCDGDTNDRDPDGGVEFFADVDEDGFGDPADSRFYCVERGVYNERDDDDCDDTRSLVNPSMNEDCGTVYDDDCDGDTNDEDPDGGIEFFADVDEDGFGDPADSRFYCEERGVYNELDDDDCDDTRSGVNPDMNEVCSTAYDDDCDGDTNDRDPDGGVEFFADVDEDGFGDPADSRFYCEERGVYNELLGDDCDDTRSLVNPDMNEVCSTSYDDNCDGDTNDEDPIGGIQFFADVDEDGFGDPADSRFYCEERGVYNEVDDSDCDDTRSVVNPSAAETCSTAFDDDCDGDDNDEGAVGSTRWYKDADGDGWGHETDFEWRCEAEGVYSETDSLDCDDTDSSIYAGATETCDMTDSDCDGSLLDGIFPDSDGDGDPDCADDDDGDGFTDVDDCNDTNDDIYPGAPESCDAVDSDCDGSLLDGAPDTDGDGDPDCIDDDDGDGFTDEDDCDDADDDIYPGAPEICDLTDSDCDGSLLDGATDTDGDGYPDCVDDDVDGDGFTADVDCNDSDEDIYPGAVESCDLVDSDCDGSLLDGGESDVDGDGDPDCVDDDDGDGFTDEDDCNDTNDDIYPGAPESCDAVDSDCDGSLLDGAADADGDGDPDCIDDDDGDGYTDEDDCDDADEDIYPGASESCDLTDSDCDGSLVDEFVDSDGDGDPDCVDDDVDGDGFAADVDCDDSDEDIYPGAVEICDLVDSDCDGSLLDGGESDLDGDGQPDCADTDADGDGVVAGDAPGLDCDDFDDEIYPGQPDTSVMEGVDEDCDTYIDEDSVLTELAAGAVLVFSEMQVNPHAIGNERKNEWFELTNVSAETLYLDNWVFENCNGSSCTDFLVSPDKAVSVEPGEVLLFCFQTSHLETILGFDSCDYSYGLDTSVSTIYRDINYRLRNDVESALSMTMQGSLIDDVNHKDGFPASFPSTGDAKEGLSLMLDFDFLFDSDADTLNDDGDSWCHTTDSGYIYDTVVTTIPEDNYGSPGDINPVCPGS